MFPGYNLSRRGVTVRITTTVLAQPHPQIWFALGRWIAPGLIPLDAPAAETLRVSPEVLLPTCSRRELEVELL